MSENTCQNFWMLSAFHSVTTRHVSRVLVHRHAPRTVLENSSKSPLTGAAKKGRFPMKPPPPLIHCFEEMAFTGVAAASL